jgi:hypothetical protein
MKKRENSPTNSIDENNHNSKLKLTGPDLEINENLINAIRLREEKDATSNFYRKLEQLNDRINVYQELFLNNTPTFIKMNLVYQ